jgi:hypothetical protein
MTQVIDLFGWCLKLRVAEKIRYEIGRGLLGGFFKACGIP